jgi:hypothetical protein
MGIVDLDAIRIHMIESPGSVFLANKAAAFIKCTDGANGKYTLRCTPGQSPRRKEATIVQPVASKGRSRPRKGRARCWRLDGGACAFEKVHQCHLGQDLIRHVCSKVSARPIQGKETW